MVLSKVLRVMIGHGIKGTRALHGTWYPYLLAAPWHRAGPTPQHTLPDQTVHMSIWLGSSDPDQLDMCTLWLGHFEGIPTKLDICNVLAHILPTKLYICRFGWDRVIPTKSTNAQFGWDVARGSSTPLSRNTLLYPRSAMVTRRRLQCTMPSERGHLTHKPWYPTL